MNDELLAAFTAHEDDVLDATDLLAKADGLARRYRRRRRSAQAAGAAVLGVGVVAGATGVASLFEKPAQPQARVFLETPPPPTHTPDQAMSEYFNDGYDYQNAVDLARLWNTSDITATKVEAGNKLLDGETLPVKPHSTPATAEDKDVAAFFNAGYTYDDAVELGKRWHMPDTYSVKVKAGHEIAAGETLPVQPSGR